MEGETQREVREITGETGEPRITLSPSAETTPHLLGRTPAIMIPDRLNETGINQRREQGHLRNPNRVINSVRETQANPERVQRNYGRPSYTYQFKPGNPKRLKSLEDIEAVKAFIREFENFAKRVGDAEVGEFIDPILWGRCTRQHPDVFFDGNNAKILDWLKDQVRLEEKHMADQPWMYLSKIRFRPGKGRSLYRSIMLFLGNVKEMISYTTSKKVERMMLKRAALQLPRILQYLVDRIEYKKITSIEALIKEVKRNETALARQVSKDECKTIIRRAKRRLQREYSCADSDNSDEETGDKEEGKNKQEAEDNASTASSSSEDEERKGNKHRIANRKGKDGKKKKTMDKEFAAKEEELQNKVKELEHKKRMAKLESQIRAMTAEIEVEERQSPTTISTPSTVPHRKQGQTWEEQVVDAHEVILFHAEAAQATKLGICHGCKLPGHERSNCHDVTNRQGRPKRIFGLCFNCGQKGHMWRQCTFPLKEHLQTVKDRRVQRYPLQGVAPQQYQNRRQASYNANQRYPNSYNPGNRQPREGGSYPTQGYPRQGARNYYYQRQQQPQDQAQQNQTQGNYQEQPQRNDPQQGSRINNSHQRILPQQQQQGNSFETRGNYYPRRERDIVLEEPNSNKVGGGAPVNACNARCTVSRKGVVRSATISAQMIDGRWVEIAGKVDSGADTTIGSLSRHSKYCLRTWKPVGSAWTVKSATGNRCPVMKKGLMKLRIDDIELQLAEVMLVDSPDWENLLIGEDLLQDHGLSVQALGVNHN